MLCCIQQIIQHKIQQITEEEKMKTILIEEPGKVVIKEQEKPIRKPGEVLLKILYGRICGTDIGT